MTIYLFDTWPEAYSLCRELNKPIVVSVEETINGMTDDWFVRVFPSGVWKETRRNKILVGDIIHDKREVKP